MQIPSKLSFLSEKNGILLFRFAHRSYHCFIALFIGLLFLASSFLVWDDRLLSQLFGSLLILVSFLCFYDFINGFFGHTVIAIGEGTGSVYKGIGLWGKTRAFHFQSNYTILIEATPDKPGWHDEKPVKKIHITGPDYHFSFGESFPYEVQDYLASVIRDYRDRLSPKN